MNVMANINTEQVQALEEELERDVAQLHGARFKGDRFVQPLHHHNFNSNHKPHTRDKIRRA